MTLIKEDSNEGFSDERLKEVNMPYRIRHYSVSAPHRVESSFDDYFSKKCEPYTADRLKEDADPDQETRNDSTSFGFQRTYSETNFFDLLP